MGSKNRWLLGGLLLAAGVGVVVLRSRTAGAQALPIIQNGAKVLVVGDSLAQGLAPQFKALATASGVDTASITEVSTRMQQWVTAPRRAALEKAISSFAPSVVLVSLGTNDNKTDYTDAQLAQQLTDLLAVLRGGGASVVWLLAPPMPFPDRMAPILAASGVAVVDTQALVVPRGPDDIHPTARGYAAWAEWVWGKLSQPSAALSGWGKVAKLQAPSASFVNRVSLPRAVVPARVRPISRANRNGRAQVRARGTSPKTTRLGGLVQIYENR